MKEKATGFREVLGGRVDQVSSWEKHRNKEKLQHIWGEP